MLNIFAYILLKLIVPQLVNTKLVCDSTILLLCMYTQEKKNTHLGLGVYSSADSVHEALGLNPRLQSKTKPIHLHRNL